MANQAQYDNSLKNSGNDINSPIFKQWAAKYNNNNLNSAEGSTAVPFGDVAGNVNDFMSGQAIAPFLKNLPNYANMVGQRSENTLSNLKGQVPQDVINQISQGAAERGISTGSPGGPNANSAYLRSLGLNSLQLQNQGSQDLSASIRDTPVPELFNPMSLYVPQQNAQRELEAAQAGFRNRSSGQQGQPAFGGVSYAGGGGSAAPTAAIPRWQAPATQVYGGTGAPAPSADSLWANWNKSYGSLGNSQSYWGSPAGLQNPNRPADEPSLDESISNLTSIMSGLPEWMGGGDWWNQSAPQPVNSYGGYGNQSYGPAPDFGDYWDDYGDDGGNDWTDLFGP